MEKQITEQKECEHNMNHEPIIKEFREHWGEAPEGTEKWKAREKAESFLLEKLTRAREEGMQEGLRINTKAGDAAIKVAYELGREEAVEYIKKELKIEDDFSPHADYVLPFKVLESARSLPKEA